MNKHIAGTVGRLIRGGQIIFYPVLTQFKGFNQFKKLYYFSSLM